MTEQNPPVPDSHFPVVVVPLPIALYISGELIFELYEGGQPRQEYLIRWERLVPGTSLPEGEAEITSPA